MYLYGGMSVRLFNIQVVMRSHPTVSRPVCMAVNAPRELK